MSVKGLPTPRISPPPLINLMSISKNMKLCKDYETRYGLRKTLR